MNRRTFLGSSAANLSILTGVCAGVPAALAAEPIAKSEVDVVKFADSAVRHFMTERRSCSESILMAGCEALQIEDRLLPDIALGFAGGIGMQGETCGVLTGSTLVLSIAIAVQEKDYAEKKRRIMNAVGRVHAAFKKQCEYTDCRSLTGLDLTTTEGQAKLKAGVRENKCAKFVRIAATILAEELKRQVPTA